MKSEFRISLLVFACTVIAGCITPQAYVDPQYHKADYAAIHRPQQPIPVKVEVHFQRNGKPLPAVDSELRGHVERTLRATGVFTPSTDPATQAVINIIGNNIADIAAARAKGFGTGLTFGGAGTMVDDNYEFTCAYRDSTGRERKSTYQHAIHTAIGHTQRPVGLTPTTLPDAVGHVIEDVVLNFVKDTEDNDMAPSSNP